MTLTDVLGSWYIPGILMLILRKLCLSEIVQGYSPLPRQIFQAQSDNIDVNIYRKFRKIAENTSIYSSSPQKTDGELVLSPIVNTRYLKK